MKYKEESDMAKGGFPGGMGGMNMNNLMKQAQNMPDRQWWRHLARMVLNL